ncbi:DUF6544 family protein [Marinobacter arenosus]|uniref:DUF6544 family protein n=1 Tax=Marinobacter arenosus TaxID=2856822 RepID=UPI001C4B7AA4|nr:DUF6544 family protein [Marinobacter arenosus]MBW0148964.1 hypothetical protein [Marinobacter arenosus]
MNTVLVILSFVAAGGLIALWLWRKCDHRADLLAMGRLAATQPLHPQHFEPAMVDGLPEPAQRYFLYTIAPGTPLYTVVRLEMIGRFGMGDKGKPSYLTMAATQVLAPLQGFVWKMSAGRGLMRVSGSDTERWTRFWLGELIPVARAGGNSDHALSAFGRYVAESVFWSPAALLPRPGVRWDLVDENTARVTVRKDGLEQAVDVTVAKSGQPTQVSFLRWSDANPEKLHRFQPFGGYLSEFRDFGGFRLPTKVEAGNFFGTADYFPFFLADITDLTFPGT